MAATQQQQAPKTAAPAKDAPKEKAPKAPKVVQEVFFDSADKAIAAAQSRTKGPRRAFKVNFRGQDYFVVHNNEGRAGGEVLYKLGATAEELGVVKISRKKAPSVDGIMTAVSALPEEEKNKVIEQLKLLLGKK